MRLSAAIGPMLSVLGSNSIYIVPQLMPQKKGNATDTAYNGSIPVPLPLSELPDLHSISHAQASTMVQSFSPYLGNDINSTVVMRNASMEVPYGYAMRNGTYAPTGSSLIYAAYSSNTTLSFYNATVSKAEPRLGINVAGATIDTPNMTSIIYVPVLPGRHTYSIQGMLNASLLAGNTANFTYSIRFGNGTVVNRTLGGSGLEMPFSFSNIPATENVTITFGTTGNSNYTAVDPTGIIIPTSISYYVPVTLANNQPYALPNPFQDMLTVNSLAYQSYEAANLDNIEFFYANGTIVPSWLESGNSNTATNTIYWLKVPGAFIPASSSNTLYMGFAANTVSLFNTQSTGEAPQLSSTYGQYDDGANVFDYYNVAPTSTAGWTVAGSAGVTASAPSGSYFQTTDALYANSANGDYLYTTAPGTSTNEILTYWVYTTKLGDVYFLDNSAGSGQMSRLGCGPGWLGITSTSSWKSWTAPPDAGPACSQWYKVDIAMNGASATMYYQSPLTPLGTYGHNPANTYSVTANGNYLGVVGDGAGAQFISYWNGFVARAYPPNGVMPTNISTTAAPVPPPSNTCTISLSPSGFAFGSLNPGTSIATTNSVTDTNSGNTNAYMYVYGSSWSGPGSFDVSNTSWSGSSGIAYGSANHLSSVPSNTLLLVPSGSGSNKIYWGLRVAPGAPTGTYSQTITIENSC
jgi:hypothetical protein